MARIKPIFLLSALFVLSESQDTERFRPKFHFSVPAGWMNDPNGLVYLDGEYHLHYQYNPSAMLPGNIHWGHAISTNLITWDDIGIAIAPDDMGLIFSGSAIVDYTNSSGFKPEDSENEVIVAMFTHHHETTASEQQSLAYSLDKGRTYTKYEGNPVIANTIDDIPDFRDPKLFSLGNVWYAVLAARDVIRFHISSNMKDWEFLGEFGGTGVGSHDGVWECPDFFPLEIDGVEYWVMLVSIDATRAGGPNGGSATQYFIGNFNTTVFTPIHTETLWLDWGADNYAAVSYSNVPDGRVILTGWMSNWLYARTIPTFGWRGQMTLPRELRLVNVNGNLRVASVPARETEILYKDPLADVPAVVVPHGESLTLTTQGNQLLHAQIDLSTYFVVDGSTAEICFTNSLSQEICTGFTRRDGVIFPFIDRTESGITDFDGNYSRIIEATREATDLIISFEIFLDVSAIEVFIDGGLTCMTSIFYPDQPYDNAEIRFDNGGNTSSLLMLSHAQLRSLYSMDELTTDPPTTTTETPGSPTTTNSPIVSEVPVPSPSTVSSPTSTAGPTTQPASGSTEASTPSSTTYRTSDAYLPSPARFATVLTFVYLFFSFM